MKKTKRCHERVPGLCLPSTLILRRSRVQQGGGGQQCSRQSRAASTLAPLLCVSTTNTRHLCCNTRHLCCNTRHLEQGAEHSASKTLNDQTTAAPGQSSRSPHITNPPRSHTRERRKGDATRAPGGAARSRPPQMCVLVFVIISLSCKTLAPLLFGQQVQNNVSRNDLVQLQE